MKQKYWMLHYSGIDNVDGGLFDFQNGEIRGVAHLWQMTIADFNEFVGLLDEKP